MFIPKGIYVWLFVSSLIVAFDASYVLLRPQTLKGGKYFDYYAPYELYIKFDTLYGNNSDPFVIIQSWLNVVEICMVGVALFLSMSSCIKKKFWGAFIALLVSAFTFWKTVIYIWYGHSWLAPEVMQFTKEAILIYILPTSFWVICPLLSIYLIGKRIASQIGIKTGGKQKQKKQ